MRTLLKLILLIFCGLGIYITSTIIQSRAAAKLCARYPIGSQIENLDNLDGTHFLTQMGPIEDPKLPGVEKVIFCASLTMCDTSCSLTIENGLIKNASYSDY